MKILLCIRGKKLPVFNYGGTERVVWSLAKELSRMGHSVVLMAAPGSSCPFAEVVHYRADLPMAEQIPTGVDIIHFHDRVDESLLDFPHVFTKHGNVHHGPIDRNTIFVSRDHAARFGSDSYVYNGLDWDEYGPVDLCRERTYFHFLGNAAWCVKNVRGAISTVKAIPGGRLKVLGGHRFNFKMGIRLTFSPRIGFEGMVGGERKNTLLNGSRGLVLPVLWDEPFGLAITESLYFGAPVFGTPHGSLPELVTPDVGFLTERQDEMVSHIVNDYHYSPKVCHDYAVDNFNSRLMAERYLEKYRLVLDGHALNGDSLKSNGSYPRYEWIK